MFNLFKKNKTSEEEKQKIIVDFKRVLTKEIKGDIYLESDLTCSIFDVYEFKSIDGFIDDNTLQVTFNYGNKGLVTRKINKKEIDIILNKLKEDSNRYRTLSKSLNNLNYKIIVKY